MKSRIKTIAQYLIGWPLSILALFFIGRLVSQQWTQILVELRDINYILLIAGMASFGLYYGLRSIAWHFILSLLGYRIPYVESTYAWAQSEIKRYIPGNVWSFLGRTFLFSQKGVKKADIARGLLYEIELILLSGVLVSFLGVPFLLEHDLLPFPNAEIVITTLWIFLLVGTGAFIFQRKLLSYLPKRFQTITRNLLPRFAPSALVRLLTLSLFAFFFFGLGYYFTISSLLYLDPKNILSLSGFFVLSLVAGLLSVVTPTGLGIREGAIAVGLSRIAPFGVAAFAAFFSRIVLILTEVLFLFLALLFSQVRHPIIQKPRFFIRKHPYLIVVAFMVFVYTLYFSVTSFARYDQYYTGRFDLGNMAQTVWNTKEGRFFTLTNPNGTENVSRLAFHADFFLIFLTPFYFLWENPKMLLLIQTVVVASGAFFVYAIAKRIIKNAEVSVLFAFAYLMNPSLQRANIYDFHAVVLATTFFLGAFYFLIQRRYWLFVVFAFLAAITKEQVWLIVALLGGYIAVFHKKRLLGSSIALVSLIICYYLVSVAIPANLGSEHFALEFYADYGGSPGEIIRSIIFFPQKTLTTLTTPDRIHYFKQLFIPVGYLPFLAPIFLIFAAPDLGINLLSSSPQFHQIYYQYTAIITPFLFIGAIYGVVALRRFFPTIPLRLIAAYLLIVTLYGAYKFGPLPGEKGANLDMYRKQLSHKAYIDTQLAKIPEDARVAATNNLGSHLSHRQHIYVLPFGMEQADIVAFLYGDAINKDDPTYASFVAIRKDPSFQLYTKEKNFYLFKRVRWK